MTWKEKLSIARKKYLSQFTPEQISEMNRNAAKKRWQNTPVSKRCEIMAKVRASRV